MIVFGFFVVLFTIFGGVFLCVLFFLREWGYTVSQSAFCKIK